MNTTSLKIWFHIMVFTTLVACIAPPVVATENIDLYDESWIYYDDGVTVLIYTNDLSTGYIKLINIYTFPPLLASFSHFKRTFEANVKIINEEMRNNERNYSEIIGYTNIDGEEWIGTWTPDGEYTYHLAEYSPSTDEIG